MSVTDIQRQCLGGYRMRRRSYGRSYPFDSFRIQSYRTRQIRQTQSIRNNAAKSKRKSKNRIQTIHRIIGSYRRWKKTDRAQSHQQPNQRRICHRMLRAFLCNRTQTKYGLSSGTDCYRSGRIYHHTRSCYSHRNQCGMSVRGR